MIMSLQKQKNKKGKQNENMLDLHVKYHITRNKKSQRTSIAYRNDPEKILIIGEKYAQKNKTMAIQKNI